MHSLDSGCCSPTGAKRISGKKLVFLSGKSIWTKLVEIDTLLLFYFAGHLTTTFLVFAPENAGFRRLGYVLPHTLSPPIFTPLNAKEMTIQAPCFGILAFYQKNEFLKF